jgi:hypothetical protein
MPVAGGSIAAQVKYHYQDHDTDVVSQTPPVQNTWYTAFEADDVRLLYCRVYQKNDEGVAKNVEVRWTIDGTVYLVDWWLSDDFPMWLHREYAPSAGGTAGLVAELTRVLAMYYTSKRGQSVKCEIRMTAAPGTNQTLTMHCVRETLEET